MVRFINFKYLTIAVATSWLIIFTLCPSLFILILSFLKRDFYNLYTLEFTTGNYKDLFDPVFFSIFLHSFKLAFFSTLIILFISYPFAFILVKLPEMYKKYILILVIIPFWTSSLIRAYSLIVILKTNGILNTLLISAGIISQPLNLLYTDLSVYIGFIYTLLPFMILPVFVSLDHIDTQYINAAFDLGANKLQTFLYVILPLSLPGVIVGSILVFIPALALFYIPDLLGGARSVLIGNFIRDQFLVAMNWPLGASSSILLYIMMGLLLFLYFIIIKRITGEYVIVEK
jgi:spermidine/putrescine transport system permease protein